MTADFSMSRDAILVDHHVTQRLKLSLHYPRRSEPRDWHPWRTFSMGSSGSARLIRQPLIRKRYASIEIGDKSRFLTLCYHSTTDRRFGEPDTVFDTRSLAIS